MGAPHYRIRNDTQDREWKNLPAYRVGTYAKDTAGSGDWCSAGIIHVLCRFGRKHFENLKHEDMRFAMNFGQALAALNCYCTGARGLMYNVSREKLEILIQKIWNNKSVSRIVGEKESPSDFKSPEISCPKCLNSNSLSYFI